MKYINVRRHGNTVFSAVYLVTKWTEDYLCVKKTVHTQTVISFTLSFFAFLLGLPYEGKLQTGLFSNSKKMRHKSFKKPAGVY